MQYVFAAHVPVPREATTPSTFEELTFEVVSWMSGRLGLNVEDADSGAVSGGEASGQWSTTAGDAGRIRAFRVKHADSDGRPWSWHVDVWVGEADGAAWIRARVGIRPTRESQIIDPIVAVGTPRFIHSVIARFDPSADGLSLSGWSRVEPSGVGGYVDFLMSAHRTLPVIAITKTPVGPPTIDPATIAARLRGVAHVVAVDPKATYLVSDLVSPQLSCFGGAARIYWPGFNKVASPLEHQLWVPRTVVTADVVVDEVVARVGRAAALVFGPPRLEMTLRRELSVRAAIAAKAEREAQAREREALRSASGGLSAEEFEVFSAEFDALGAKAADYERRIDELELELEVTREDREKARDAERQAWAVASLSQRPTGGVEGTEMLSAVPPLTVRDAVDQAASRCANLRFLQQAFEGADESQYPDPPQVLADLLLLNEVATMWVDGTMGADFRTVFQERHNGFRPDISTTASTRYADDYNIQFDGRHEQMGPHLRRGVGPPPKILGIYWFKDDVSKKLVVGHVGRKLRDESNRN